MPNSMTGFATIGGARTGWSWTWELRSVNGRGLDLKLRLPDRPEGVEQPARAALQARVARGNVTLQLRLQRDGDAAGAGVNAVALETALAQIAQVESAAAERGVALAPTRAADILTMRGITAAEDSADEAEALRDALLADLPALLDAFVAARADEGAAIGGILSAQVDAVEALVAQARERAAARGAQVAETLRANVEKVMQTADGLDPDRLAQEVALIVVKQDVTEELDRLDAHVAAARDLLAAEGPVGRKFDFLMQEFNREANTLCSKSQNATLTRTGLDLKTTVDQMREQVQNVE